MKKYQFRKIATLALSLVCAMGLAANASAASVDAANTATSVPVQLSAEATRFSVTLPTALPTSIDPGTGETTTAKTADITNNSAGSVRVTQMVIINKTSADLSGVATGWNLKGFSTFDFANADVDSNYVGVSVRPVGGRSKLAAGAGTALMTTSDNEGMQTLLTYTKGGTGNTASADEWVMDAKNDGDTDKLTLSYDTAATRVSADIVNQQVASLVITVGWNKG